MLRAIAAAVLIASAVPAASVGATPVVTVRLDDRGAAVRPMSVARGTVRFVVSNAGTRQRAFAVANRRTPFLKPGGRATLTVRFARAGSYRYTIATRGLPPRDGRFDVVDPALPPEEAEPRPPAPPVLTKVGDFELVTDVDAPPGDARRVVVVEQQGTIRLLLDGERAPAPFLDLTDRVTANGEAGLLSIAFAPDYGESGRLFAFYNDRAGNIVISELRRSADDPNRVDPASERPILRVAKSAPNHNGGMLQFGPGGLYASIGDGGVADGLRPGGLVQSPDTAFGKVLRLDVDTGAYTIVATGFRNPWRFWIDPATGDMLVADVGQELREEVDVVPAASVGLNYGWPCFEGTLVFDASDECPAAIPPLYEYAHGDDACSITGGPIVRDPRLPALAGAYLFGDFCGGPVRALRRHAAHTSVEDVGVNVERPVSFGVDALERVYVATVAGALYRLDPAP